MKDPKMLSQFSAIYGQIFCCGCPGGISSARCDNRTGIVLYPVIANSYAWLAGLLSVIVIVLAVVAGAVIYCKKRRDMRNADISIIGYHDVMLPNMEGARPPRDKGSSCYRNPGFVGPEPADVGGSQPALVSWGSEESVDSPFLLHSDSVDVVSESGDTRPLTASCDS